MGLLCLADRGKPVTAEDRGLLEAIASHASIALENARLFTRMEQASRHWMEIFDAITDFIVVHDEGQNILRVNRSLADFIGVPPSELVGVNMRALEALSGECAPFVSLLSHRKWERRLCSIRSWSVRTWFRPPHTWRQHRNAADRACS